MHVVRGWAIILECVLQNRQPRGGNTGQPDPYGPSGVIALGYQHGLRWLARLWAFAEPWTLPRTPATTGQGTQTWPLPVACAYFPHRVMSLSMVLLQMGSVMMSMGLIGAMLY